MVLGTSEKETMSARLCLGLRISGRQVVALLGLMAVRAEQDGAPCSILKDGTSGHFGHWLSNRMTSTSKKGIIRVTKKRQG